MSFAPRRAIVTASESGIEPPVATGVGVGMVAGMPTPVLRHLPGPLAALRVAWCRDGRRERAP